MFAHRMLIYWQVLENVSELFSYFDWCFASIHFAQVLPVRVVVPLCRIFLAKSAPFAIWNYNNNDGDDDDNTDADDDDEDNDHDDSNDDNNNNDDTDDNDNSINSAYCVIKHQLVWTFRKMISCMLLHDRINHV